MENTASTKAHKFFGETLPLLVEAQKEKHLANQGRISFRIGEESWTFRFGEAEAVQEGADETAGLKMSFEPSAFDQFLASNLDMRLAVNAGTIKAEGDFELLKQFGQFIETMTPRRQQAEEQQKFHWNFS